VICDNPDNRGFVFKVDLIEREITRSIIGAFYDVYNTLGFGFHENIYVMALERELIARGHQVGREVSVMVYYKGEELGWQRLDMVVDGKVVVETKSTYELPKAARRQLLNYLHAARIEVGLLLHFGPEANFYRIVYRQPASIRGNPAYPRDPRSPSVVDGNPAGSLRDDVSSSPTV
jgi:GxxExxY protein